MNLFSFFTGKSGKVAVKPLLLGTTAAIGLGAATMGSYQADSNRYDRPSRTLAELHNMQDNSVTQRLGRASDGMLTAMPENFRNASGGVGAVRMDEYNGNDLARVDNVGAGVAAALSGAEGLSQGGGDFDTGTITQAPRGSVSTPGAGEISGATGGAAGATQDGATGGARLARASMAQASGSGFQGTAGPVSAGGIAGGASAYGNGRGANGQYELSGAMPSSSADLAFGARTSASSSFGSGDRTRVSRTRGGVAGRGDLESIAKYSAKVAAKGQKESANAGAGAFLNGQMSGGITLDGAGNAQTGGSSSDLGSIGNLSRVHKGINNWQDDQQKKLEEQKKARKKLGMEILALIAATVGAAFAMHALISKGQRLIKEAMAELAATAGVYGAAAIAAMKKLALGKWLIAAGWGVMAGVSAFAAIVLANSISFMNKYQGNNLPTLGIILSAASIGTLTYVGIKAMAGSKAAPTQKATEELITQEVADKGAGSGVSSMLKDALVNRGVETGFNTVEGSIKEVSGGADSSGASTGKK